MRQRRERSASGGDGQWLRTGNRQGTCMRLYILNLQLTWTFVFLSLLLTTFSGFLGITDMAVVTYGIPAAFAELGIHTGFIVWKSKVENCRKYKDVNRLNELESEV